MNDQRVWPKLVAEYKDNQVVASISFVRPGHPDRGKKLREQQAGPRRTAEQFLAAALAGRDKEAAALTARGSAAAGKLEAVRKTARGAEVDVKEVFLAGSIALVTTSDVSAASNARVKGPLLLRLVKQEDEWLVDRIDMHLTAPITRRVTEALKERPPFPGMI